MNSLSKDWPYSLFLCVDLITKSYYDERSTNTIGHRADY